jgi:threonyl-tRNA synthetase
MEKEKLERYRHSLAHILALAVKEIYPKAKFAIGPSVDNGFYYDIDFADIKISDGDLGEIEKKMKHIVRQNLKFKNYKKDINEAIEEARANSDEYKLDILKELKEKGEKEVSFYTLGDFDDLCSGPHLESTSEVIKESFKLDKVAGAYWRGDENNKMLTRIYGLAFPSAEELKEYIDLLEEAKKRDHKKIGRDLDLFSFHPESPGMVHWHGRGMVIWNELESLGQNIRKKYGSVEIKTPQMAKSEIWKKSGHWDYYKDDMFVFDVDNETYCLKPMDCPFNINIFNTKTRSYRDLPIRYTEIGRVFRNEKSGQLNGLLRVREISQDDSHVFCALNQIEEEIVRLINMTKEYYSALGISPQFFLSTRPDNFMGEKEEWDQAEEALKEALESENIDYQVKEGDGAFYGPKIDVDMEDALKRLWQVATIQLDFQLPQRFDCNYIDEKGDKKNPIMLHAAIFGSFERMIGILTEHYAGAFPLWMAPVQLKIISVGEKHIDYCKKLEKEFLSLDLRSEIDVDNETLSNKIRKAITDKIPYIIIIGDKELESGDLAIRKRGDKKTESINKDDFINSLKKEISDK